MTITQDDIVRILKLLDQSSYEELELQDGNFRLSVSKSGGARSAATSAPASSLAPAPSAPRSAEPPSATSAPAPSTSAAPRAAPPASGAESSGLVAITAPMLGAFYRSPKPGDPPFVEIGSIVNENDTVCLIEVMKTYTTVPAGVRGRVAKILVENTEMVEHKQPLFLIEPV